jgi:hypothetical protein
MTRQKTAWFVQYKDNREIVVVKRIICYLNLLFTKIEIRKILTFPSIDFCFDIKLITAYITLRSMNLE